MRLSEVNLGSVHPTTTVLGKENLTLGLFMVLLARPCLLKEKGTTYYFNQVPLDF